MCMCCFVRLFAVIFFINILFSGIIAVSLTEPRSLKLFSVWKVSPAAYRIF